MNARPGRSFPSLMTRIGAGIDAMEGLPLLEPHGQLAFQAALRVPIHIDRRPPGRSATRKETT